MPMLKLKKIPVGKKHEGVDMPVENEYPPTIHLTDKQGPEIKDWSVGKSYQMIVEVKQTSMSENKDGKEVRVDASFEITAYKVFDDLENMSDEDLEYLQGKGLAS